MGLHPLSSTLSRVHLTSPWFSRTEILAQVDLRVARRVKPNLVPKLSSYGQDLLAGGVETREKLVELEEERVSLLSPLCLASRITFLTLFLWNQSTLSTEIASLQAVYDSLVASSSALTLEVRRPRPFSSFAPTLIPFLSSLRSDSSRLTPHLRKPSPLPSLPAKPPLVNSTEPSSGNWAL